jgi:hypothetical protein
MASLIQGDFAGIAKAAMGRSWQYKCLQSGRRFDYSCFVQPERKHRIFRGAAKSAFAGFLVFLLLGLAALAASPGLHELIHSDAGASDHHCAVTLFAGGQIDSASAPVLAAAVVALFGALILLPETFVLPSADYRYSSSRAPPSCSFLR